MKPKAIIKLVVDIIMTMDLLFLMGYHLWGEAPHELAGAAMLALFITHHILNLHWHKSLFKGKYNAMRILTLVVDILVLASMLIQMYSGIVMSRHMFAFFRFNGSMAMARRLHILGAYWGFILMSLHLGLHWNTILGITRKTAGINGSKKIRSIITFIAGLAVAGYGVAVFINRDFPANMILKNEFVFLDYNESKLMFYIDYLALMGFCIFVAHYGAKLIRRNNLSSPQTKNSSK